jgi:hypothetical protein
MEISSLNEYNKKNKGGNDILIIVICSHQQNDTSKNEDSKLKGKVKGKEESKQ